MDAHKIDARLIEKLSEWRAGTRPDEQEDGSIRLNDTTEAVRTAIVRCGVRIKRFGQVSTFHKTPLSALNRLLGTDPPYLAHVRLSRPYRPLSR